jgi:uncharacterized membrane protein YecN with MAPEG domain
MPAITITPLYAGILGLMAVALAAVAGRMRGQTGISLGDGGNPQLLLAMRRHANFIEFVPLTLILIGLLELNGVSPVAIHCLGGLLVVFRVCHAAGIQVDTMAGAGRAIGAGGSTLLLVVASIWSIVVFAT